MKTKPLAHDPLSTLTLEEVADFLGVDAKTVRREMVKGELRFTRVGKLIRFKRAWVNDYLERFAAPQRRTG